MLHIAIVEDDIAVASQLHRYLEQYGDSVGEKMNIITYSDGEDLVHHYRSRFDIILIDTELKFMDGVKVADEIRRMDSAVLLILLSDRVEQAMRGYSVEAFDFLLKPVSYQAVASCLSRAGKKIEGRSQRSVMFNVRGGVVRLDPREIYYVESIGHSMIYHTATGTYESFATMKETEELLPGPNFFRASKWYLVNLSYVDSVRDGYICLNGETLAVSRTRRKELIEALASYLGDTTEAEK